jgi:uncharacterized membrane protein
MSSDFAERTHRRMLAFVGLLAVAGVVGMIVLRPISENLPAADTQEPLVGGVIESIIPVEGEPEPLAGLSGREAIVEVRLTEGDEAGTVVTLNVALDGLPDLEPGDQVRMARFDAGGQSEPVWSIVDFERSNALWLVAAIFVVAVVGIGRWHGLRALLGLGVSLLVVIAFVVPAILSGRSPSAVALVGALVVMLVTLYLGHGVNEKTTAAVIGTTAALVITASLGLFFIEQAGLTGFTSEDARSIQLFLVPGIDLSGLVLAGLIIAALGVLDDVTISQASTVFALHDTDRTLPWRDLFGRAMTVGRDHIASTVNTLFLAYAGASLTLLILFSTSGATVGEIVNSERFAEELVKTLVGSVGLIAAVPLTTALAATVAVRRPRPVAATPSPAPPEPDVPGQLAQTPPTPAGDEATSVDPFAD